MGYIATIFIVDLPFWGSAPECFYLGRCFYKSFHFMNKYQRLCIIVKCAFNYVYAPSMLGTESLDNWNYASKNREELRTGN